MSAIEWRVLAELYERKEWKPIQRLGVAQQHFQDDGEARQVFEFLRQHYHSSDTRKQFPSKRMLNKRFPGLSLPAGDGTPLETLCKELKNSVLSHDLKAVGQMITDMAEYEDLDEAMHLARALVNEAGYKFEGRGGVNVKQVAEMAKQRYMDAKSGVSWGIEWPWHPLTWDTKGRLPADLIYIYARQKQMKTWISTYAAADSYVRQNKRVIFWSREMTVDQMAMRFASIWAGADYTLVEHGLLPKPIEERYMSTMDDIIEMYNRPAEARKEMREADEADILFLVGRDAPNTFDALRAAIDEFEPDELFFDSIHHLQPDKKGRGDSEEQGHLARQTKQLAIDIERSITASGHANREGEKLGNAGSHTMDIGRSDAWAGEADLLMRVIKKRVGNIVEPEYEGFWDAEEERIERMKRRNRNKLKMGALKNDRYEQVTSSRPPKPRTKAELAILISGSRRGTLEGFTIEAIPGYHFPVSREEITPKEVKEWMREDDSEEAEERDYKQSRRGDAAARARHVTGRTGDGKKGLKHTRTPGRGLFTGKR